MYISVRVTPQQKEAVKTHMKQSGYNNESEYVLSCCLKGVDIKAVPDNTEQQLSRRGTKLIFTRVTESEKDEIRSKFNESGLNNFSQFVRNCCLGNPIIVIDGMKEFATELNRVGNNLNQLTMLCHQGLISNPNITETTDILKKIYKELVDIKLNSKLRR